MARPCSSCSSEHAQEINRKLRSGATAEDVARWLVSVGSNISVTAVRDHRRNHVKMNVPVARGRRPIATDFLEDVRDRVHEGVIAGELSLSVKDGIAAQKALDERLSRNADRDLAARLAIIMFGPREVVMLDDEQEAIEAEFRPLLTP